MSAIVLEGPQAFYNQTDYQEKVERDFAQEGLLPVQYTWKKEGELQWVTVAQLWIGAVGVALSVLENSTFFKILALTNVAQLLCLSLFTLYGFSYMNNFTNHGAVKLKARANQLRADIPLKSEWKFKRLTIDVNGHLVDAVIVGKPSTLNNGKWMIVANRINEVYEEKLKPGSDFMQLVDKLNCNAIVLNYPAVGQSAPKKGWGQNSLRRDSAALSSEAALQFLEDKDKGIGAKTIISYSHLSGGWVQEDVLRVHALRPAIKYVVVRNNPIAERGSNSSFFKYVLDFTGLDFFNVRTSNTLEIPEVILSPAKVVVSEELHESSKLSKNGHPLANAILNDPSCDKTRKLIIGTPEHYEGEIHDPKFLAEKIDLLLTKNR